MTDIRERLRAVFALEHREHLEAMRAMLAGDSPDPIEMHRRAHSLKGAARAVGFDAVVETAHALESQLETLTDFDEPTRRDLRRRLDRLEDLVNEQMSDRPSQAPATRESAAEAMLRVEERNLERLLATGGDILPDLDRQSALAADLYRLRQQVATLNRGWRRLRDSLAPQEAGQRATTAIQLFDRWLGELAGSAEQLHRTHERTAQRLRRGSHQLRQDLRDLRMVSAGDMLAGLGPALRDLARQRGRQIDLRLEGLGVEADRLVLQALKDSLTHMLRNAVAHGIEPPDERQRLGKAAEGVVTLALHPAGGRIRVELSDDGRGIDPARLADAAVRLGRLRRDEADALPPERLTDLIFDPGMTTADSADQLAGRGIGLSVVRQAVDRLQGEITVRSQPGVGTRFVIEVPQRLTAQTLLIVEADGERYALPSHGVARLAAFTPAMLRDLEGRTMAEFDGQILPTAPLAALLDQAPHWPERGHLIVIKAGERRAGLAVERVHGILQSLVHSGEALGLPPQLAAGTILLDDGTPALVLQPAALCERAGEGGLAAPGPAAAPPRPGRVLVVDDSITTRTLERSILEARGYHVLVATDGAQGLQVLRGNPVDVVVSDVEMPHLDGFAFLRAVKEDPALADTPFILVTSRDSPEDRERGLHLGADAYIIKGHFNQDDLVEAIRRLT